MHNESIFNKLDSMSDVILTLVNGVKNEWVKMDSQNYGYVKKKTLLGITIGRVCYGCMATNALCELMGEPFKHDEISDRKKRAKKLNFGITLYQLEVFEHSLDYLRRGYLKKFSLQLAQISEVFKFDLEESQEVLCNYPKHLPEMNDINLLQLKEYEKLAAYLKKRNL